MYKSEANLLIDKTKKLKKSSDIYEEIPKHLKIIISIFIVGLLMWFYSSRINNKFEC